jgi:hypothetical protein
MIISEVSKKVDNIVKALVIRNSRLSNIYIVASKNHSLQNVMVPKLLRYVRYSKIEFRLTFSQSSNRIWYYLKSAAFPTQIVCRIL